MIAWHLWWVPHNTSPPQPVVFIARSQVPTRCLSTLDDGQWVSLRGHAISDFAFFCWENVFMLPGYLAGYTTINGFPISWRRQCMRDARCLRLQATCMVGFNCGVRTLISQAKYTWIYIYDCSDLCLFFRTVLLFLRNSFVSSAR